MIEQETIFAYYESLTAEKRDARDKQQEQIREEYNRGREAGIKYAIDMMEKHGLIDTTSVCG